MEISKIIEILSYTIPAIITGGIALYFFKYHIRNEEYRRNFLLRKEKQKIALPMRLQAYERLILFLERISPSKLMVRVRPTGKDPILYQNKLIQSIEQEYEHNLVQQIYITDAGWNSVVAAKNAISQLIRSQVASGEIENAAQLQENVIKKTMSEDSPTQIAIYFLKKEVKKLF